MLTAGAWVKTDATIDTEVIMNGKEDYQCPKCKRHAVSIDDCFIRCLSCGLTEPLDDFRKATPYIEPRVMPAQLQNLEDRLENVEELVAAPGSIPRQFHDELQQIQGRSLFLQEKLNEHLDRSKKRKDRL